MPFDGIVESYERFTWFTKLTRMVTKAFFRDPGDIVPPRQRELARESVIILDLVAKVLDGDDHWIRGRYRYNDRYCIVGALRRIRSTRWACDNADEYLLRAIVDSSGQKMAIIEFNDTHNYREVMEVIAGASRYAQDDAEHPGQENPLPAKAGDDFDRLPFFMF